MKNLIFSLWGLTLCFCLYQSKTTDKQPTPIPQLTEIQDSCNSNVFHPIKLTGAIGSIKTDSVRTDKINFPMYSDLLNGKPNNWGKK
jgi:hypothetical protein